MQGLDATKHTLCKDASVQVAPITDTSVEYHLLRTVHHLLRTVHHLLWCPDRCLPTLLMAPILQDQGAEAPAATLHPAATPITMPVSWGGGPRGRGRTSKGCFIRYKIGGRKCSLARGADPNVRWRGGRWRGGRRGRLSPGGVEVAPGHCARPRDAGPGRAGVSRGALATILLQCVWLAVSAE